MNVFLSHTPETRARYYGAEALAALREIAAVTLHEGDAPLEGAALAAAARGCAAIIADRATPGTAETFTDAGDLVAFLRCAVDVSTIDVGAASAAGVLVTRATPGFGPSVAELAVGFMIDLARGISRSVTAYRQGETPRAEMGRQLDGASVGIIGHGVIGRRLATLCAALGMNVLVFDPHATLPGGPAEQVAFDALLARADFVVCLAPATEETRNLMNADAFARMRADAFFINLSRGSLVDEDALAAALDRGTIAGAAMDVGRAPAQMPRPRRAARAAVIAPPHTGGRTPAAVAHQAFDTVAQVRALAAGTLPPGAINPEAATRLSRLGIG